MTVSIYRIHFHLLALLLLLSIAAPGWTLTEEEKAEGYIPLFNGVDLSGWKIMGNEDAWKIEGGTIHALPNLDGGYIESEESFGDFILRVEYKTGQNANSGVFMHVPKYGRQSRVGGEIQIFDSYGKEPTTTSAGALYDKVAPLKTACKPAGEWNDLEIHYEYPQLVVKLNDVIVQNLDVSQDERIAWRKRFGPFGLQEHGNNVWFRNVRVKDLGGESMESWTPLFPEGGFDLWQNSGKPNWKYQGAVMMLYIETQGAEQGMEFPKDRERWNLLGQAEWKIQDPEITGKYGDGFLVTRKAYKNFELWAYVKTSPEAFGGIWYRWKSPDDPGYCVTLWNDRHDKTKTGGIAVKGKNWRDLQMVAPAAEKYVRDVDWFPLQIIAKDGTTWVIVNGNVAAKYEETEAREGRIGLTVFSSSETTISLQDVRIRELD